MGLKGAALPLPLSRKTVVVTSNASVRNAATRLATNEKEAASNPSTSAYMVQELVGRVTSADGERGGLSGLGMMGNDVLHRMGAKNRASKAPRGAERCPRCETSNRSESFQTFQTTQALDGTH